MAKTLDDIHKDLRDANGSLNTLVKTAKDRERREIANARYAKQSKIAMDADDKKLSRVTPAPAIGSIAPMNFEGGGGILGGLGLGALAGAAAALAGIALLDAGHIKTQVETLLSIGDRWTDGDIGRIMADGAVVIGLKALGTSLMFFAAGGALNAGVQYFSDGDWSQKVKDSVETLLSIADLSSIGNAAKYLVSGATVPLALRGLGIGLAAFGVGQALTGLGQWATDADWAVQVKDNVQTLLSISDGIGESVKNLFKGVLFVPAMIGLAAGLGAFAIGQAATGLAQFVTKDDWAQRVHDSVETLLSISQIKGIGWNTAGFLAVMGGLGLGLVAFGAGTAAAAATDAMAAGVTHFTDDSGGDWAQTIKDRVTTLLSISKIDGIGWDVAKFATLMAGISAGLLAFSLGTTAGAASEGIATAINKFTGEEGSNWAQTIKDRVTTLVSITDEVSLDKATNFKSAMTSISEGLGVFAKGGFVSSLEKGFGAVVSFLTGTENRGPIGQVVDQLALLEDFSADKINQFSDAIAKLGETFTAFSGMDAGFGANMSATLKGIGNFLSAYPYLMDGGTWTGQRNGYGDNINFGEEGVGGINGVLNGTGDIERAKQGIQEIMGAFTMPAPAAIERPNANSYTEAQQENEDELIQSIKDLIEKLDESLAGNTAVQVNQNNSTNLQARSDLSTVFRDHDPRRNGAR